LTYLTNFVSKNGVNAGTFVNVKPVKWCSEGQYCTRSGSHIGYYTIIANIL